MHSHKKTRKNAMKLFIIATGTLLILIGCATMKPRDFIHYNPRYYGEFTILRQISTPTEELYAFQSPSGIFSFDIQPFDASLKKVTFIFSNLGTLSGLCASGTEGEWIELYGPPSNSVAGVSVINQRGTFTVDITDPALNFLRPGVRFTVIDQYRE